MSELSEELHARYYRWWTVRVWRGAFDSGIKFGPVTAFWYRWLDGRLRFSLTHAFDDGREHILWGGPLA